MLIQKKEKMIFFTNPFFMITRKKSQWAILFRLMQCFATKHQAFLKEKGV